MKLLKMVSLLAIAGVVVLGFQNCNQAFAPIESGLDGAGTAASQANNSTSVSTIDPAVSATPVATATPQLNAADMQYISMLTTVFTNLPITGYLSELGISAADFAAISPAQLASGVATSASITMAATNIVGDIDAHASIFSLLTTAQKAQALNVITSSIAEVRAVSSSSLDSVDQTSQIEVLAVLTEFQKYL